MCAVTAALFKEMFMTRIRCTILFVLAGLAPLVGCGGTDEGSQMSTVVIDTSSLSTDDAIAQAAAAEHGAPGENEQIQHALVGDNVSEGVVAALHERGFANISVGAR
jgi:hypothetical protein